MKHKVLIRLLRPGAVWALLLAVLAAASLVFVFTREWHGTPFAYAAYGFSAYATVILVIGIPDVVNKMKALIYANRYGRRYMADLSFRTRTSLHISLAFNLLYAVFKLLTSLYYESLWFGAVAVYYIILSALRFLLLRHVGGDESARGMAQEYRKYRLCGGLLFVVSAALSVMVIQMIRDGRGYQYPGYLIYAAAAYAFYSFTFAIINMVKYRKRSSPVQSAARAIHFATALVAMLSLQTAMFASFGGDEGLQRIMNTATGSAVCIIVLCAAVFMVVRANRELKKFKVNNLQT